MKYSGSLGSWLDDDEPFRLEDFRLSLQVAADRLASNLETRALYLRQNPTWDVISAELRSQMCAASVSNRIDSMIELNDFLVELLQTTAEDDWKKKEPEADPEVIRVAWDDVVEETACDEDTKK